MNPISPEKIKRSMVLFNIEGKEEEVIGISNNNGVISWYTRQTLVEGPRKTKYTEYEYDYQDYGEGLEPWPLLFKKSPVKGVATTEEEKK